MTDSDNLNKAAKDARAAVEHGENIRDTTRNITMAAFSQRKLDTAEMKKVVRSVMQGASLGLDKAGEKSRLFLGEAVAGVDEALAKSAEATKLAIEEASGRLQNYGKRDLERAFADLRMLEEMFLDTLKDVADQSAGTAKEILHGLLKHARDSGTSVGTAATTTIEKLEQKLGRSLHDIAATGADAALSAGSGLAEAASGFMAGIAETLHAKGGKSKEKK